jgi:hypothetical protein
VSLFLDLAVELDAVTVRIPNDRSMPKLEAEVKQKTQSPERPAQELDDHCAFCQAMNCAKPSSTEVDGGPKSTLVLVASKVFE